MEQRIAPEIRRAHGHLGIQSGGAHRGRQAQAGVHQVDGDHSAPQLACQIQKLVLGAEGAQKIVAAARRDAAHGSIGIGAGSLQSLPERAVPAGGPDPHRLSGPGSLPGEGFGVALIHGADKGAVLPWDAALQQRTLQPAPGLGGGVLPAGGRVEQKQVVHRFLP